MRSGMTFMGSGKPRLVAYVEEPVSGRVMEVFSAQPGLRGADPEPLP
jgi:hypothetical protein